MVTSRYADHQGYKFSNHLTTCRIGNLTRLIHTLAICVTIHTYIMVTTRYADQQGFKFSNQPTENIGNLSNEKFSNSIVALGGLHDKL